MIYSATKIFSRFEYIGETSMGLMKRVIGHIRRAIGGKTRQKIYRYLGRMGVHKFVWTPVWAWQEAVTRIKRMRKEGG